MNGNVQTLTNKTASNQGIGIIRQEFNADPPSSPAAFRKHIAAYSVMEVLVAAAIFGFFIVTFYSGLCYSFGLVRLARENLRASQILVQRTEDYRLYNWDQLISTNIVGPSFIDYFDPSGTNTTSTGTTYRGNVTIGIPSDLADAYRTNMRTLTVTVFWTNYPSKPSTNLIVRSRQMQTTVARFGMQNFVSR